MQSSGFRAQFGVNGFGPRDVRQRRGGQVNAGEWRVTGSVALQDSRCSFAALQHLGGGEADWVSRLRRCAGARRSSAAGGLQESEDLLLLCRASGPQNVIVMGAVAAAAAVYADGGYTTIVDGIISPQWFLYPLRDALATGGHAVSYAILRPTLATCITRAGARTADELSNPDVITKLWNNFADLGGLELHVIDVEELEPRQVADTVTSRWQAAELLV